MNHAVTVLGYNPNFTLKGRLGRLKALYHVIQRLFMDTLTGSFKNLGFDGIIYLHRRFYAEFFDLFDKEVIIILFLFCRLENSLKPVFTFVGQNIAACLGVAILVSLAIAALDRIHKHFSQRFHVAELLTFAGAFARGENSDDCRLGTLGSDDGSFDVIGAPLNKIGLISPAGSAKSREQSMFVLGDGKYNRQLLGGHNLASAADDSSKLEPLFLIFGASDIGNAGQAQFLGYLCRYLCRITIDRLHAGDHEIVVAAFEQLPGDFSDRIGKRIGRRPRIGSAERTVGEKHHLIGCSGQTVAKNLLGHRRAHRQGDDARLVVAADLFHHVRKRQRLGVQLVDYACQPCSNECAGFRIKSVVSNLRDVGNLFYQNYIVTHVSYLVFRTSYSVLNCFITQHKNVKI